MRDVVLLLTSLTLAVGLCFAPLAEPMHSISLATYTIEVHALRKHEPLQLQFQSGAKAASLHGDLLAQLQDLKAAGTTRDDEQQVLKVARIKSDATDIWGIVERGEFGSEARIVDSKTLGETHLQSRDEARLGRFYFRLHLPDAATKGILILQRTGGSGAYTALHRHFEEVFREKRSEFRLRFARAVHPDVLNAMLSGKVYAFRIVSYKPTADIANWVKGKGATKNVGEITVSATAVAEKTLWSGKDTPSWFKKIITEKKSVAEVFPHDNIKSFQLTADYHGQRRTFDLTDPEDIFPYQNITADVVFGTDGHPVFASINDAAIGARDELIVKLGISPVEPTA